MTKESERGGQLVRILGLLHRLESHRLGMTVDDLAVALGVTRRTIFRDIKALEKAGYPIDKDKSDLGGTKYQLSKIFTKSPKIPFTQAELLSLYISLKILKPIKDIPFIRGLDSALNKIEETIPARSFDYIESAEKAFLTKTPAVRSYADHLQPIEAFSRAARERLKCRVTYLAYGREKSDIHVYHPYALSYYGGALYCVGFSELRNAVRTFAVHRVQMVEVLGETFAIPDGFDAEEFLAQSFGISHDGTVEEVVLRFTKNAAPRIMEREWHPSQKIVKLPDGGVEMSLHVTGMDDLYCWLMPMADDVTVVKPKKLADAIVSACEKTIRKYGEG